MGVLRLILAIAVVIAHTEPIFGFRLVGSDVAVQAFYIISGFYMAMILTEKYARKESYKLFITNRFLRLYPIYWIVLLGTVLMSIVQTSGNGKLDMYFQYYDFMNLGSILFLIFTNILIFFQDIVMFLGLDTITQGIYSLQPILEKQVLCYINSCLYRKGGRLV
jgi:peptidoglycan/LPS O-acetylase OafA/YrhL